MAAPALMLLLLLGLALRLTIAYVLFPGSGFSSDIGTFVSWSLTLAEHGPGAFYATTSFADYPPGYLYVLWLVGGLGHLLAPLAQDSAVSATTALIKLPPMLLDIVVGYVLYRVVRGWAAGRADAERLGLLAAALYVFNPVTWYDSALWGQTDAAGALVVLLAVAALVRGNSEGAAVLTIVAALVKPQFGVVLAPVVAGVLIHRHLLAVGSGPRHAPLVPQQLRSWFEQERGAWRLLSSATAALFVMLIGLAPFGLDLFGYVNLMLKTAGGYAFHSVNAYNIWALIGSNGNQGIANGGAWSWNPDTVPLLGPVPGVVIGGALLLACFVAVLARLAWRADRRSIVIAAIVAAIAFFLLPTRAHERYMFPVFALLPLLAVIDRRWLWATVAMSVASFINLHMVLTDPLYATPNVANLPLGELFRQQPAAYVSVFLHVGVFLFAAWRLRPAAAELSDESYETVVEPMPAVLSPLPEAAGPAAEGVPTWAPPIGAGLPLRAGRAMSGARSLLGRLTAVVPVRRDRSALLAGEGGGRLDRFDALALLLVFVAALGLRTLNLAQPYGMHFDEVYHARTGTEFLQHWRYGIRHSVYEWTHPHLAKYLMAVSIDKLGNNRVIATAELGASVKAAALERRWDEDGGARSGDRVYIVSSNEVIVRDLATGQRLAGIPIFAEAAAVDDVSHTLFLADADGGIWQLPTLAFDVLRTDPGAPTTVQPQALATLSLPGRPLWLTVAGSQLIVGAEGDTLVSIATADGTETGRTTLAGASDAVAVTTDAGEGVAVGAERGIYLLDRLTLEQTEDFLTDEPITGLALVTEGADKPTIYAAAGDEIQLLNVPDSEAPSLAERLPMPGSVRDVYADPATALVHVLGDSPDGTASSLYVIEPHAKSVFADALLPFAPQALVMDVQPRQPASDRLDALAFSASGSIAVVDVGGNSFAWRFPGVLLGALMAVCIYLLARFLFRRRSIAVLAGLVVLADGMMFANARIAMNDAYVAFFIVAALTLFAPLYVGRWRSPLVVAPAIVGVGVLLGLALASKWVGAYALGGLVLLILLRSALGRLIALAGMLGLTAVLGYIAIAPGPSATQLNFLFLGLMVALTTLLAVGITVRPMRLSRDELRLAVGGPIVAGVLAMVGAVVVAARGSVVEGSLLTPGRLVLIGVGLFVLASGVYLAARAAARYGYGPLAETARLPAADFDEAPSPPPAQAWLRPGGGLLGVPWLATLGTLALVPLLVYVISYSPWIALGNRWTEGSPTGNTGQTLLDLQKSMYDYHNNLRATHAASSPWWAWPANLKPVWFYQHDFAGGTTGTLYDNGNLVLFWLAIPAVAFAALMAWRRRSLALALVVVMLMALWLPWARIDRATFQYHIFTTLPFSFLALAYFLAELWHGPSARTWLLARVAAALMIIGPALLWLLRLPLCAVARVDQVSPNSNACLVSLSRSVGLTDLQLVGVLALIGGLIGFGVIAWLGDDAPPQISQRRPLLLSLTVLGGALGIVLAIVGAFLPGNRGFQLPLDATLIAIVALVLLTIPAWYVLRARDARRFVVGAMVAAFAWFVLWYPNISGLPVPTPLSQLHVVGIPLPTYIYDFQFGVNQDPAGGSVDGAGVAALLVVVTLLMLAAIYATRSWREARRTAPLLSEPQEAS